MIKSIIYIAPHKTALTVSLVMANSSLLFIIPMIIMFSFMLATDQHGNPINARFPFIMPVFYFMSVLA